jgi:phosphatidylserine/phosphatidylglycerophosphate/cardiolipin synthase-like enzyme
LGKDEHQGVDPTVLINSRFHQVVWEVLLTCAHVNIHGGRSGQNDNDVIIASPWISDLEHKHLKLSSPLLDGIERTTKRELSSLMRVIELLVKCDYDVHVVTSEPGCSKWKANWSEEAVARDRFLQEHLTNAGVNIVHDKTNHAKTISTPLAVITGSANLTDNGFFKNTEHMTLTMRTEDDFTNNREVVKQLIS